MKFKSSFSRPYGVVSRCLARPFSTFKGSGALALQFPSVHLWFGCWMRSSLTPYSCHPFWSPIRRDSRIFRNLLLFLGNCYISPIDLETFLAWGIHISLLTSRGLCSQNNLSFMPVVLPLVILGPCYRFDIEWLLLAYFSTPSRYTWS